MRRSVIAATVLLATGSACRDHGIDPVVDPLIMVDPVGTIARLTVTPDRGRPGSPATVTWEGGEFTHTVRLKHGPCTVYSDGTALESRCPSLVAIADDLPQKGNTTVTLGDTGYYCAFPVRHGGMFAQGRCVLATVLP